MKTPSVAVRSLVHASIRLLLISLIMLPVQLLAQDAPAQASNELQDVTFTPISGGRVQIRLKMAQQPDEPGSFSINRPARIAFDFFNTTNAMGNKTISVSEGAVENLSMIQAGNRTRVVLSLVKSVEYETHIDADGMTVTIGGLQQAVAADKGATRQRFATAPIKGHHKLQNIDFRRGPKGEGMVMITMSDPSVGIDITERPGEITVEFLDTETPQSLERRLDVIDFATPVKTVDAFTQGRNSRIVIAAEGDYKQLAYQAGSVFTINVQELKEIEKVREVDEFGYSGEGLSLNFKDIPVRSALQVIADFTGINFITSDDVEGNLTLKLKDVPWDQALDVILQTKGLAKRQDGNVIWVAPAEEIAAKEKQQLEATKTVAELEPLVSELIAINYAKAEDIAKLLKSVRAVSPGVESRAFSSISIDNLVTEKNSLLSPRGNVTVDERTNSILVQDTAGKIRDIKKLIARLDQPVRQVLIETRIVEANDDFSRTLGARFGITNRNRSLNLPGAPDTNLGDGVVTGRLENTEGIYNEDTYLVNEDGLMVDLPSPGLEGRRASSLAFTIFKIGATHLLALELSALEAEQKGKIIASPRLVTANQKEAFIEQGQERIFPPSGLSDRPTLVEAKLRLTVTPQITPENSIILDVLVEQDTFVSPADPTINTKRISTQVLLDNGETVVIGGVYQEEQKNDVIKTPFLGDLPFVGALFRERTREREKVELLIFLTPKILSSALDVS